MRRKKVDMNELTKKVMEEIGLDLDGKYIIDQDVGNIVKYKQRNLVINDSNLRKGEVLFDPANDLTLSNQLLSYHGKNLMEDGVLEEEINIFYINPPDLTGKSTMVLKTDKNTVYESNAYYNDTMKVLDMIFRLSGEEVDLSMYDEAKKKKK